MGSILHLHTVPPTGGDTLFASSNAAYEALSEPMKKFLGGLTARHDGTPNYNRRNRIDGKDDTQQYPHADHPVIRTHPVTGKKALYVNEHFTRRIVEMNAQESDMFLAYLTKWVQQPPFTVRYQWTSGTIGMWQSWQSFAFSGW